MSSPITPSGQRDIRSLLHPMTNLVKHEEVGPFIITRGEGIYVYDERERRFLEGMSGLWCAALGFSEKELVRAATAQMERLPYYHSFYHRSSDPSIALADRLREIAPVPIAKVFLVSSGSEANDTAMKLVWYYNNALERPRKKKIISRRMGFHGVTVGAASLTGISRNHQDFDLPIANVLHTENPHYYRYGHDGESEEAFATRMADTLEQLILAEGPDTVAAFIAEPVMGAGGVIVPPATYFEKVQAVLERHDVLFIVDEVICGFGRTGNMWGSQTFNLRPDIITCAKGLSSAYQPIAAVLISEGLYEALLSQSRKLGVFAHGYTYGGHPVSAAVALRNLELFEERHIVEHVRQVSGRLQEGLRRFAEHPLVGEVRGVGLVGAVELVADKATRRQFDPGEKVGEYVTDRCLAHGLILRALQDSVAVCPPLIITAPQIDELLAALGRALDETWQWVAR